MARTKALVRESKDYLTQQLEILGLPYICGEGNYVIIRLPFSDTLAYRKLMRMGYMVRTMTGVCLY
ncbi:MAG: histidinol-phosphate transaminase [Firmicutes bacterium]|nr:histidinol-phosphate transaminase [Bacillota bacterium]